MLSWFTRVYATETRMCLERLVMVSPGDLCLYGSPIRLTYTNSTWLVNRSSCTLSQYTSILHPIYSLFMLIHFKQSLVFHCLAYLANNSLIICRLDKYNLNLLSMVFFFARFEVNPQTIMVYDGRINLRILFCIGILIP